MNNTTFLWPEVLPAVLFLWVSPAVTASPYGKTMASSGAAVIYGGMPLVIEKLLGLSYLVS